MIIALFPNTHRDDAKNIAIGIAEFLTKQGATVVAEEAEAAKIGVSALSSVDEKKIEFMISMGGDGSILRFVNKYKHLNAAVLGINMGHLGFMADVPLDDLYPSLQDLINGAYVIEERLMLQGEAQKGERAFAVNDIVFHRGNNPSLVEIAIHLDGVYVNTFEADGIIIATPNGSTAYSLAAGGPIISPTLEALSITPICPHTISNRPIVLTSNHEIQLQYLSPYDPIEVRADGLSPQTLQTGDLYKVTRAKKPFRLVNLHRRDYFSTLRTKLGWHGKLR